jgi:glutamine synthetase
MPKNSGGVQRLAKESGVKIVDLDLRFADLPGVWQHFSIPVEDLGDDLFGEGIGFDGSSIRGFQLIHESESATRSTPGEPIDKDLYELGPHEAAKVKSTPGSLGKCSTR